MNPIRRIRMFSHPYYQKYFVDLIFLFYSTLRGFERRWENKKSFHVLFLLVVVCLIWIFSCFDTSGLKMKYHLVTWNFQSMQAPKFLIGKKIPCLIHFLFDFPIAIIENITLNTKTVLCVPAQRKVWALKPFKSEIGNNRREVSLSFD